ncbi:MAG: DUF4340 domain-containing protein [Mobilitalea sp.]
MNKRKKRNIVTMISLLFILAALLVIYLLVSKTPAATDDAEEVTPAIDLAAVDTTQLKSLHYVREDTDLTLILKDEVWISEKEPERPINQDYVEAILNAIDDIKADRLIMENPESLADYGLAEPMAVLEANLQDGTTVTVKVGNEAGDSLGYYGMVNEDGTVYLLPIEIGSALQYNDTEMTAVEEATTIEAANITSLTVNKGDGEKFELKYAEDDKLDNAGTNNPWQLLSPYGEGYTAVTTEVTDFLANYTTFTYLKCVDYKGEDLEQYGLEEPAATINLEYFTTRTETLETPETDPDTGEEITEKTYKDEQVYTAYIGDKNEDGDYYIRVEGSNLIYTIGASEIDTMLSPDAFSIVNSYIDIPSIDSVDQVVIESKDQTYTLKMERSTEENAEGEEETTTGYYYNTDTVEEDAFKTLYQSIISLTYDAEVKDAVDTEGVQPYLALSFQVSGEQETTLETTFLPYDDSFYLVEKDGKAYFLVDKRKVEDMLKLVQDFK